MNTTKTMILAITFIVVVAAFATLTMMTTEIPEPVSVRVVRASDVAWQALNPLRGDKSPRAGTLWGDRGAPVPCGFLVKFVDGFSSPPHIHPVTYRGVVVHGLVHNDVPEAKERWLPPGSFWTQPAGEVHITAAKGSENVAYIEIERGPYLVHPAAEAFPRPEVPIQMEPGDMTWADAAAEGAAVATLAGNPDDEGLARSLVRIRAGFEGRLAGDGAAFHIVVIAGRVRHDVPDLADAQVLDPGSYVGSTGSVAHQIACDGDEDCLLYVRTRGNIEVRGKAP